HLVISSVVLLQPLPRSHVFPYTTLFRSRSGADDRNVRPSALRTPLLETFSRQPSTRPCVRFSHTAITSSPRSSRSPPRSGLRKRDRKSTRLNSSHVKISYAVFCLKKKTA